VRFAIAMSSTPAVLPRWAQELARQLKDRGSQASPAVLGPVTAARELRLAAAAVLAGHPAHSRDDRASLRDDVRRALEALGSRLAAAAAPALAPVRNDLGRLPGLLAEANGALVAVGVADATLDALADRELVVAAWDDAREAFEAGAIAGVCELRIEQLAELVVLRGGDWRSTADRVNRILFDDRLTLAQIGAIEVPELESASPAELHEPAGLDLDERLRLAREEAAAEPPTGEMVGWVCFRNAFLRPVYADVGGVEFFGHQLWPDGIAGGYPDNITAREEFSDESHKLLFWSLPDEPFVLASVPLGHRRLTDAVGQTRSIASDLVRAAQPHSEWRLIKGAAVYVRGADRGWFGDPLDAREHPEPERYSPQYEPTSTGLERLAPALVEKLLAREARAHDAVRDVEWVEAVSRVPDAAQRLALSTRLVERALPAPEGAHWTEPVRRYLRESWAEQEARELISDAAKGAVDVLNSIMSPDRIEKRWHERLTPSGADLNYTIRLDETIRATRELLEDLPDDAMQTRVVAELADHARSPDAWLRYLDELERSFDILLARLVRQRNAVLHGADTVPEVVASVSWFVVTLQGFVIYKQLDAAAKGRTLLAALERNRIRVRRIRNRLEAGESPAAAMFEKG
jgi:hypothetical protein